MARFKPTRFMAEDSKYNKKAADYAVSFIECLSHTKGTWAGKKFELLEWQEQIIRDLFGILKPNGYRQFNTAYIEIPKKNGKSELAAAVALLLTCGDGEERAEVYGCAADRQQAAIVFDVAADMVRMCPALSKRVKILTSQKRIVYIPTNSFYQVLSAEAYSKHGFNIHGVVFDELHTQYYVEDDHEAIIPRALFLQVQEEIARRGSQVDCMGRRRGFSAKHCFTGLLYCAECGEQFRRIHWNNRGCKSVVWRCMTRLEKKGACHARTVYEESLKQAFVDALNQLTGSSETYLSVLQKNMAEVIEMEQSNLPEEIQRELDVLHKKLIECAERHEDYEEIAQEIFRLREQKEQALRKNVSQQEQKDRMRELQKFLAAQPHHITEFDETLVRHLLAKVTVSFDRLDFTFQSGVAVSIEK